jgi:6-phosphogluconolactonase
MNKFYIFLLIATFFSCKTDKKTTPSVMAYDLFVGTYTQKEGHVDGKGEGVYRIKLDENLNEISRQTIGGVTNPSWIELVGNHLFCAEEMMPEGKISSFLIKNDSVTKVNSVSSKGGAPCHLAALNMAKNENMLLAANYMGSNVVSFSYDQKGKLSEAISEVKFYGKGKTERQTASHPHHVLIPLPEQAPAVWVTDLGTDTIYSLSFDEYFKLKRNKNIVNSFEPGSGPRHLSFDKNTYVLNELNSTISVLGNYGTKNIQNISTLPADFKGQNLTAEIIGQNPVYVSNRGHNSIAMFKQAADGKLENIGFVPTRGDCPRNMNFSPDGKYVFCANQNSDNIVIFKVEDDKKLSFVKELKVKTPVCLQFLKVK